MGVTLMILSLTRCCKWSNAESHSSSDMEDAKILKGDKLVLRGLKFHGYHGVLPEERKLGQKFVIDVDAYMDLQAAGKSDDVMDTINYTDIYNIAKEVVEGTPRNLQESVAEQIASAILMNHPKISAVRLFIRKPHIINIAGVLDCLGVEIVRYQSNV